MLSYNQFLAQKIGLVLVNSFINFQTYLNLEFERGMPAIDAAKEGFHENDNSVDSNASRPFQTAAEFDEDEDIQLVEEEKGWEHKANRPSFSSVEVSVIKPNDQSSQLCLQQTTSKACHQKPEMSKIQMGPSFLLTANDDDVLVIDDEGNELIPQSILKTSIPAN